MGNAFAYLGLRSPDRVPVLCGRICDAAAPHRGRGPAGRPRMAVADRDELWEVSVGEYIVETNHVHNISQSS